jgi:hypothetical protein
MLYKQFGLPFQLTTLQSSNPKSSPLKIPPFRIPPKETRSIFKMHVNKVIGAATATATLLTSVYAQLTAPEIVANINVLTDQSREVKAIATNTTDISIQQIVIDFSNIATSAYDINSALAVSNELSKLDLVQLQITKMIF